MSVLQTARSLANEHPELTWSCPLCGAEVKGANFGRHLDKVHGDEAVGDSWQGRDRAIWRPSALAFLTLLGVCVLVAALKLPFARPIGMVLFPLAIVGFALAAATALNALPATLRMVGGELELVYGLGRLHKRLSLNATPLRIEVGTLKKAQSSRVTAQEHNNTTYDVKVGSYMRLQAGGKTLTLASKKAIGLQHRWQGAENTVVAQGAVRRDWDVMVPPTALIATSLALAGQGRLLPRTTS
jgi:hypothetical protein